MQVRFHLLHKQPLNKACITTIPIQAAGGFFSLRLCLELFQAFFHVSHFELNARTRQNQAEEPMQQGNR